MRTGKYDPADASVKISGDAKPSDDASSFASKVDDAIKAFRVGEVGGSFLRDDGWATPNRKRGPYCAEPVFSPDSNTLKLHKGNKGQLGIYAKARADGGRATGARWTLLAPLNAEFSPSSSQDPAPSVSYDVTNAPDGGRVEVTVKVTSTAGVGQKSWTQPTEAVAVNHIEGTFGGELSGATSIGVPSVQRWSGVATFDRITPPDGGPASGIYLLSSGNVSIDLSGVEQSGLTGCLQSGSAQAPLTSASVIVTGTGPEKEAPYSYEISVSMPFLAIQGTRHTCPEAAQKEGWEGTQFEIGPVWKLDVKDEESGDGLAYVGSKEESFGSPPFVSSFEENWTFHGKP